MKQTVDWHSYWVRERQGFHEGQVNTYLKRHLRLFDLTAGDTVFMPLCGKAVDILWLSQQGFNVIGVEISEIAIKSFFDESNLQYSHETAGHFTLYRSGPITLLQGDYMDLTAAHLMDCKLVYDRASIVAIEAFNRQSYVAKMQALLPAGTPMLVVTLEYDQQRMSGPPYSVPVSEIEALYSPHYQVEVLTHAEQIDERPGWRDKGLQSLQESALRLTVSP